MGVGLGEGLGGLGALPGPLGHSGLHTLSSLLWFLPETEGRGTDGWCLGRQSLPGGHGHAASWCPFHTVSREGGRSCHDLVFHVPSPRARQGVQAWPGPVPSSRHPSLPAGTWQPPGIKT